MYRKKKLWYNAEARRNIERDAVMPVLMLKNLPVYDISSDVVLNALFCPFPIDGGKNPMKLLEGIGHM